MKIARGRIAKVVAGLAQKPISTGRLAKDIAAYLLSEGRTGELDSLMRDVQQYRAEHGIVEATALSAYPLNNTARTTIKKQVKEIYPGAKQVILNETVDPSVISGVRIILANERLDLTARAKLNKLNQLTAA